MNYTFKNSPPVNMPILQLNSHFHYIVNYRGTKWNPTQIISSLNNLLHLEIHQTVEVH